MPVRRIVVGYYCKVVLFFVLFSSNKEKNTAILALCAKVNFKSL